MKIEQKQIWMYKKNRNSGMDVVFTAVMWLVIVIFQASS